MALDWETTEVTRRNRYLDWEVQNRRVRGDAEEARWCPVLIEVKPDNKGIYHRNLKALQELATEDSSTFWLRMTADEEDHLDTLILDINDGVPEPKDPVGVWFFVYLKESSAYQSDGAYADTDLYAIHFVGAPIPTLTFGLVLRGGRATEIPPPGGGFLPSTAVGIVDDGIAFAHERFQTIAGQARVQAIWLQTLEVRTEDNGVAFGKRLQWKELNDDLQSGMRDVEIYRKAGLLDFASEGHKANAFRRSHGTHILDVAAGFDPAEINGPQDSPIFAVQLPAEATADTSGITMGSYVLQGIRQIMLWADRMGKTKENPGIPVPLTINFSYGILAGPKDGTHDLEWIIDSLANYRTTRIKDPMPTKVVLPSGNSYRNRDTARMTFSDDKPQDIDWVIQPDDATPNFLEIWLDIEGGEVNGPTAPVELQLTTPDNEMGIATLPNAGSVRVLQHNKRPVAAVYYDCVAGKNSSVGRGRIFLAVNPTHSLDESENLAPAGQWNISLKRSVKESVVAKFFIQRDDTPTGYPRRNRPSYFSHADAYCRDPKTGDYKALNPRGPVSHEGTISAIANGCSTLVVGAAEAADGLQPADYTSSGPSKTRLGPDLSAIADDGIAHPGILAAGTYSGTVVSLRGTSVAAPQLVRRMAYELTPGQWGSVCSHVPTWPTSQGDKLRLGKCILKKVDNQHIPPRKYSSN